MVLLCCSAGADDYREAFKQAGKALYKHSGIDERMYELERRYVPEYVRKNGGPLVAIADVLLNKRVSFKWTF
jgi:hypothetical protein